MSHETIYLAIYIHARGGLKHLLDEKPALRTRRRTRRTQHPHGQRARFADLPAITDRPAEADTRTIAGHMEGDLIIGAGNKSQIATIVDRTTRHLTLIAIPSRKPADVAQAIANKLATLPGDLTRSLTWDRGPEMVNSHHQLTHITGCNVYFADPHSPWQRGTNENTNGLLRQYLPKSTNLNTHTQHDLDTIANQLNNRPRKTLNWATPNETLHQHLTCNNQ